jgi:tetratricopeptide (TPR) repeat protein
MKFKDLISILVILFVSILLVHPVAAADTTPKDNATTLYNAGVQTLGMNDYAGALDLFDRALAENTTSIAQGDALMYLYEGKAYALINLHRFDDALQTTKQGLTLYGMDSKLWNNQGFALYNLGKYQDAVTAYDHAIALDGNYTSALINKGGALYKLGDYTASVAAYNRALETDPGNADAADGLKHAQDAAGSLSPVLMVLIAVVVIAAAGAVWYVKFRKPAEEKPAEKKGKAKGKKK